MMKTIRYAVLFTVLLLNNAKGHAQDPVTIVIQQGIKKAIIAMDLRIQRLQNETIWLQNVQKVVENAMSKIKLGEISDWVERQGNLYKDYYEELWKAKSVISYYQKIKSITQKEVQLLQAYKKAWIVLGNDPLFTPQELIYMEKVFRGMVVASSQNLDELVLLIRSFSTQMSDAKRMELIDSIASQIDGHYRNLVLFSQQQFQLSAVRKRELKEIEKLKRIHGTK